MKRLIQVFLVLLMSTAVLADEKTAPGGRVVIISIDGLRPDVALRANMPHLRSLMARGSFSFWANTTDVAITLPSHTSMLTGVTPDKHGIHYNDDKPSNKPDHPLVPSIFELAKKQGHTTALAAGKHKFQIFDLPGVLDWKFIKEADDDQVASMAAAFIHEHHPELLFVHLPECDRTGHRDGWGTPQQIETLSHTDEALGKVLAALDDEKLTDSTTIILSADHGGSAKSHGGLDPRSRHIPWIAAGPGIKVNYDLTFDTRLVIHTEDTFATACDVLKVPLPDGIDGKPVIDIFKDRELLDTSK